MKPIVLYGAQQYCAMAIKKLLPAIRPTHIIPNGPNTVADFGLPEVTLDDVAALRDPLVLIARSPDQRGAIRDIAHRLREFSLRYDHISHFFAGTVFTPGLLSDLGLKRYTDERGNEIILGVGSSDRMQIRFLQNCSRSRVEIGNSIYVRRILNISLFGSNALISIGDQCSFIETNIESAVSGKITIGNDCMFSFGIVIGQPDHHPIFDLVTLRRINHTKDIAIGNHVWVGRDVRMLGGANIGNGSVVGAASVTSSRFPDNVVIAGSPARKIRKGVLWARDTLASQNLESFDQCKDQSATRWLDD